MAETWTNTLHSNFAAFSLVKTNVIFAMGAMDKDGSFSIDIEVTKPTALENGVYTFEAQLSTLKMPESKSDILAGFTATYWCGIELPEAGMSAEEFTELFAATTVWSAFATLFAVVQQQMGVNFPVLPSIGGPVRWKDADAPSSVDAE